MRFLVALLLLLSALPAWAQDASTEAEDRSYFIGLVENQLSGPNRQIRINGIQGALSSNATISEITIADREGVWLRIINARIDWTRRSLLLGRLDIDTLSAERIDVIRRPLPEEGLPPPEASTFALPELPLSIVLRQLEVPTVTFGDDVFGLPSQLSVAGRFELAGGSLESELRIQRQDGPGGDLSLDLAYSNANRQVDVDLTLNEPENGILANLLNIEGRPAVRLAVNGAGPLDGLDVALTLDAGETRVLTGRTAVRRQSEGLAFDATLEGPIATLVPAQFRAFFGQETAFSTRGVVKDVGGFRVDVLDLRSAALALRAAAETGADGFLQRLTLDATVDNRSAERIVLPVPGGQTTVQRAGLTLSFGEGATGDWSGSVNIDDLATEAFTASAVQLALGGVARDLPSPATRNITFKVDGAATGIIATRADVAQAIGDRLDLDVEGAWTASTPVRLARAVLTGNGLSLSLAGDILDYAFKGDMGVRAGSIAPFSEFAGRPLEGSLELTARGDVLPFSGGFDLALDGRGEELRIGIPAVDALLGGTTTLAGGIARGETGLVARDFRVANAQFDVSADGSFATGAADFGFEAALSDLAQVSDRAAGRLTARGRANGTGGLINLSFRADVPTGALAGKSLRDGSVGFEGTLQDQALTGQVTGDAFIDRVRAQLAAAVSISDGERRLTGLDLSAGGARLRGDLLQTREGLFDATLALDAPDISTAASLFLAEASGAVEAAIRLTPRDARQDAEVEATLRDVKVEDIRVGAAELRATIADLFGVPSVQGSASASGLLAGGVEVTRLTAQADRQGPATDFSAAATLANGTQAEAAGTLQPEGEGFRLALSRTELRQGQLAARLTRPSSVLIAGQTVQIDALEIDVGGGRVAMNGSIAETLDLAATVERLPLAIANAVRPDLGLAGTIDGTARISGSRNAPQVRFDLAGRGLSAAALRAAGLSSLTLDASGTSSAGRLDLRAALVSPEGVRAQVAGAVPLAAGGQMALDVTLAAFPLAVLNAVAPGQDLAGTIAGTARVTGALDAPAASFRLQGNGISAAPLQATGAAPLTVAAGGTFAHNVLTLDQATATGPLGLSISGAGRVPLDGGALAVSIDGRVPLALANRFLAERGAQATGTLALDLSVGGSLAAPRITGTARTSGAGFADPESNLELRAISLDARLDGDRVTIASASAALASGGRISASGSISTNASAGFPADIRIALDQARYADGSLVVATVSGTLAVAGPLIRDPLVSGSIDVERAEITVPGSFGGTAPDLPVKHVNPPPPVTRTLARARADDGTPTPTGRPSVVRLDIQVNAPRRIFVRGRGLDAELGGSVRLTGPVTDIQPVGQFDLIRGRLSILAQRITFDEGSVTLVGDLDPFLNFVAQTGGSDITVFVTVRGRVSDLDVSFSSQPNLPQDEVLARLIFNRSLDELSPLQIAQLAAAAAELTGGSENSLLGNLRNATGLDDIDIVTDSGGNPAVRAGRYIQENVYLGVEAGSRGAQATINLDITEELKIKGSAGSADSSVGVFFERDY
jgi:translocation and assembly module TamB